MGATLRKLASVTALVVAASAAAAAQTLEAEWSRPVGGKTRFVGVEEYGRCSVFVDSGVAQVVAPTGTVSWTWSFAKVSKYLNPRVVAVSHECDAIAFVGDASYKYVWIVDRAGTSASLKLAATPAAVEFDQTGMLVAVGTYGGFLQLYSRNGTFQWNRPTKASVVQGIAFSDDNQHIRFADWSGRGVVSVAGHVEWSEPATAMAEEAPTAEPGDYRWQIAESGDGSRRWLRGEDVIDCVDKQGALLARINAAPSVRGVRVSRDFSQVMVVTERALHPVSVERYAVPAPCGK